MERITPRVAVAKNLAPKRTRPYRYRPGAWTLTASFRDGTIDESTIRMVATLTATFTQANVARILNCGVSLVSKCVRIIAARKNGKADG